VSEDTRFCHGEAFFAEACSLGSQSPGVTAEIASSPKTLLVMTVPAALADGHELAFLYIDVKLRQINPKIFIFFR